MNKKGSHNVSTSRIPRHKHTQKREINTIPLINRSASRITLTDLCPEQKLKVGELIKTLELRKEQNQKITTDYHILSQKCEEVQEQLAHLTLQLQQKQSSYHQLVGVVKVKQCKVVEQERYIGQLEDELRQFKEIVEKLYQQEQQHEGTQTQNNNILERAVQTKRKKIKNKEVQVNTQEPQPQRNLFYRPHSQSFEKIMKGRPIDTHSSKSYHEALTTSKYSQRKYQSSGFKNKYSPDVNNFEEEAEDCVDSLARRWREIKEKGVERGTSKQISRFNACVEEDSDQDIDESAEEKLQRSPAIEQYDQKMLNKMLKGKNFSANQLLKGHLRSIQGDESSKKSQEVSYIKSPYFNHHEKGSVESKSKGRQCSTDRNINFFESDILQLAQKIKIG